MFAPWRSHKDPISANSLSAARHSQSFHFPPERINYRDLSPPRHEPNRGLMITKPVKPEFILGVV